MNSAYIEALPDEEFLAITTDLLRYFAGNHTLKIKLATVRGFQISLAVTGKGGALPRKIASLPQIAKIGKSTWNI